MNAAKVTLTSTILAATLGLALGLMSTPAAAHCEGKHLGGPHCPAGGPITYIAELTGAFAFDPVEVTPNNRENVLRSDTSLELVRPTVGGLEQDTWDQVFTVKCPVLFGDQVNSFFAPRDDWSIHINDDESFDDVVLVVFRKVTPLHEGDGGSHAEVNVQFRSNGFGVDPFLPDPGFSSTFMLERGGINGSSVRGVHPRERCGLQIFDLLAGGELTITAIAEP